MLPNTDPWPIAELQHRALHRIGSVFAVAQPALGDEGVGVSAESRFVEVDGGGVHDYAAVLGEGAVDGCQSALECEGRKGGFDGSVVPSRNKQGGFQEYCK